MLVQDRDRAAAPRHVVDLGRQHQRRDEHDRRRAVVRPGVVAAELEHALLGDHLVRRRLVVGRQPAEPSDLERVLRGGADAADRCGDRLRHAGHRRAHVRRNCSRKAPASHARTGYCQRALSVDVQIREARRDDVALIFGWIVELAEYERARDQVTGTPELLEDALFGPAPSAEAVIAETARGARHRGRAAGQPAGFALFHSTFSTWECRPGIWLEDLYVPPAHRRAGVGGRAAGPPREHHRRARVRPPRVGSARLERARAQLLRQDRRAPAGRLDPPPARRRRARAGRGEGGIGRLMAGPTKSDDTAATDPVAATAPVTSAGPLRFARMAGSSIAARDAAIWVTDFLNAAYYRRPAAERDVDDLRLAFAILTTYWYRRRVTPAPARRPTCGRFTGVRHAGASTPGLRRGGCSAGSSCSTAPRSCSATGSPYAYADDARRGWGIAFPIGAGACRLRPGAPPGARPSSGR